jgi:site-specific DNA recombinase
LSDTLHIYTRVSSAAQQDDGTSLETQREQGVKKAKELGMVPKVWNEGGESSRHDDLNNRPELRGLLAEVDAGNVRHLWVFNPDRLSRNETTWGLIRLKLVKADVTLHTSTGIFILSSPTDKLLLGLLSEISSYDNSLRAERSRLGKLNRIKQGFWMGGPPPYGYVIEKKHLAVNKDEAKWIKFIFESYSEGKTVQWIRRRLMENGVKTRRNNGVWSSGSIEALLRNTHYTGHYAVRDKKAGETIACRCEPIISPSLALEAARVRAARSKRRIGESNQKHFYLLRDFLVCDHCEARFSGRFYPKQKRSVYYCPRKERNSAKLLTEHMVRCSNNRYLKIDETDQLVWSTVTKVISESHLRKEEFRGNTLGKTGTHQDRAEEVSRLKRQLKGLHDEAENAKDSLIRLETDRLIKKRTPDEVGKIIASIEQHRLSLAAKEEELNGKIHAIENRQKWVDWVTKFGESIDRMNDFNPHEKKELLDRVVEDIRVRTLGVRSHRLTIKFKLPYYHDRLEWNDPKNKSKGYRIIGGSDTIEIPVNDAKKKP